MARQADPAGARPGGPLVVLDLAAAGPVEVPVIHLVAVGEQQLEGAPPQVEANLDVTLDVRRSKVKDEDAGANAGVELVRAGPVAQSLGDGVVDVQALRLPWGRGLEGHRAVHRGGRGSPTMERPRAIAG